MGATPLLRGALALPIETGPFLVHALAIAVGALGAAWSLPRLSRALRGRERPLALYVAYALVLLLWSLRPYLVETRIDVIAAKLSGPWWIPLGPDRFRADVFTVIHVGYLFLLYVPLGGLLAVWPLRRRGWLGHVLPGIYLAVLAELAQLFAVGRTVSVTDMLVQSAGVYVGWLAARRAGFGAYGTVLTR